MAPKFNKGTNMKLNLGIVALLAAGSAQTLAKSPVVSAPMDPICVRSLQAAVDVLEGGLYTDGQGKPYIEPNDLSSIKISNVKTLESSCLGPADCDDQNPDAFTWSADVGEASGVHGKVVVSYHRGNCFVKKIALKGGK
jgi:hypothetical protein